MINRTDIRFRLFSNTMWDFLLWELKRICRSLNDNNGLMFEEHLRVKPWGEVGLQTSTTFRSVEVVAMVECFEGNIMSIIRTSRNVMAFAITPVDPMDLFGYESYCHPPPDIVPE